MKSLAAIAAVSTVSAYGDDAMNALHIKVSPFGQKRIGKEGMDVRRTAMKIKNAPATKSLKFAVKKWAHSAAANRVRALDKKFLASPAGKKLVKEWKDVGRVLKNNVHKTANGVHFNNGAMNKLSNELDDVSDHYEYLGTTHWNAKYDRAYKNLFTNQAFNKVKFAAKNFKQSPAGKMLGKEVREFGQALKTHVKVSDVPPKWKKAMHGLRVDFEEDAEEEINEAAEGVKATWGSIEHSPVVQNVGNRAMKWGTSDEVNELKALDEKFKVSAEGKALMQEWREFGEALHEAIEETPTGIHIHNSKFDALEDRVDDIKEDYEDLDKTHWAKEFHGAFQAAFSNSEMKGLHKALKAFEESKEGNKLEHSLKNLGKTVHENVHVSDIPEEWKQDMRANGMLF